MPLEITTLRELPPDRVAAMSAILSQLMQERHPEVELSRGVFHDLVLYFNAVLNAAVRENIDRVLQSNSLLKITQNPALAEDALVDQVLANFNVTRSAGTRATGAATFVFLSPTPTQIPADVSFVANERAFRPPATFSILPPGSVAANENQRVMIEVGDGTFAASVPFVAVNPGRAGNIRRGTKFLATSLPGNVADAFATSDFVDGTDPLTNEEYLKELSSGLTAKTIGSRKSYEAFIRNYAAFKNLLHCSVLGCGDVEQQRDQHSIFPVSGGGKVDIYLQTAAYAQEVEHILEATYVGVGERGTIWQVAIPRNAAPGFYDVTRVSQITDRTSSGYPVVQDIRGVDLTQISYAPDVVHIHEGVYSRYQTAIIRFEDNDKLSSGLTLNQSKALYAVTTRGMPLIGDIHDTLTSRDNRPRATDLLVKAAVPCFTKISFEVRTETNEVLSEATLLQMKTAVVAAISQVGFAGQLHSSVIANAAHKFLTGRQAIGHIDMFGKIRRPDGTYAYLRDGTLLTIPNDATRLVTGRTTAFLVGVDDVSISYGAAGFTV
jgi:hypothetical protein